MAELSSIKLPDNKSYGFKDLYAVSGVTYSGHTVTITKRGGGNSTFVTADTTYTLTQDSNNGHKIVFTPSSGSATTITIPDNFTAADKAKLDSLDTNKYFRIGPYDYVNGNGDILNDQNSNTLIGGSLTGIAFGDYDNNFVEGEHSVAFGYHTNADLDYSVAFGKYNSGGYIFSVGCGTSNNDRKNAIAVDTSGNVFANSITISGGNVSVATPPSQSSHLTNKAYVDGKILYPVPGDNDNGKLLVAQNGSYVLKPISEIL